VGRNAAKLIAAGAVAAVALAVLIAIHVRLVDAGAEVALVLALVGLVHAAFHLVDDPEQTRTAPTERRTGVRRPWR
jgi:gamma-glutamyl:cysteine ligase YbdK (ATP-grasp superfamily)